jgi:hypothetical protein
MRIKISTIIQGGNISITTKNGLIPGNSVYFPCGNPWFKIKIALAVLTFVFLMWRPCTVVPPSYAGNPRKQGSVLPPIPARGMSFVPRATGRIQGVT